MADQNQQLNEVLAKVIKSSNCQDAISKGLHEVLRTIEAKQALFVCVAEDCDQGNYVKLVKALCAKNEIKYVSVPKRASLGEYLGHFTANAKGEIKKVKGCSSLAIRKYAPEITEDEKKIIEGALKA
ncbi:40S ribosomal protein S12 (macronuclear) [Tetrahymena thermophila SB210]|uniref:40S ribosomal protein S12 n=2 Tax=Tetrahymena thermophila TaxID=5911 RepID=Q22W26_TETTS|nr:40S ribosomal protein S12 [Tetrahymena thermophila SB210]2XZN_U Chain U, Ribosomal Protein L7ae Containing Protein [Tetrahymena thermophila]4BPN_U Chain U, 40s Ribosomal Protein Rps12e [Tetrahymena thermophila]4BPO_U Chain U, 40s Ribosomal Protein Rps12e [Tetrahymena thermophila]4BTS_AU Chain AU, 40S RIBOSOMAL PROTEIN RPS12E [Tetrahymena thermophila]4BTS_BU Chain BU, 40S RIBOSOMAL PROTEIN RPS12E [Tetrahymena thermophila]4BTS_CU Chain CU, 40S RIBOSOMAL PROTEIN RPS12E [Tetrahymena thermophil|eukprot:XP_001009836.1 40S ribosomal protein S12 [Tetrahymena thermophila SB210]